MNFLADEVTFGTVMDSIWTWLGNVPMAKSKRLYIYIILPQLMTFLRNSWIILISFGLFIIIKILNFFPSYG